MSKRITNEETFRFTYYFNQALEKLETRKNRNKSHWSKESLAYLNKRLNEENVEFLEAFTENKSKEAMIDELKDIINIALMMWDNIENNCRK